MHNLPVDVFGLRDFDGDEFKEMLEIKRLCESRAIDIPPAVVRYFGEEASGLRADAVASIQRAMLEIPIDGTPAVTPGAGSGCRWVDIDLRQLPDSIKTIRVLQSW